MATTNKNIYYPNDYSNVADVPEDMKKLAESVDTIVSNLDTNKVDKVEGKDLSTNDFTNEDKEKLDSLENYDDTEIKQDIEDIQANDAKQDELIQKLKDNCINVTTEESTSLQVTDASTLPAKLYVRGNHYQENSPSVENPSEIHAVKGSVEITKSNNLSNFATLGNGLSSGTYNGLTFEMLNKFSCRISGKPVSSELRFGNNYNSTTILVKLEKNKKYKIKNSLNSTSEITLVNSKNNTYRMIYVANKTEITLQEGEDGISSVRIYVDVNKTYDNEIVDCVIYTQEDDDFIPKETEYTLPIQQAMLLGDCFEKEVDGWKEVHMWNKIESYNGESIATDYISTTGELSTGATVYYRVDTFKLPCTEAQSAILDQLAELPIFKGTNNIITAEGLALLQMSYIADTQSYIDSELNNINQQILNIVGGN